MKEASFVEILAKAKRLSNENRGWHFHLLGRNCKFNQHKGKFSLVLEDKENGETFFSVSEEKPLKEAKELADLMYGEGFLEEQEKDAQNPDFGSILKRAKELSAAGKEWHHHHLHPNCVFNEYKGKHCIMLEDGKETLVAVYEQKPMEDLVKIEKLFYKDVK